MSRPPGGETESSNEELRDATDEGVSPSTQVRREFLVQVVLLNLAILAIALGALLLSFRWWSDMGAGLIVVGLVALLAQLRRYRQRPSAE